ncbi:ABC transporter substrate-binding protein [Holophaga foetida]|uniref:ABC transporter substrate-binding protein n=1 Tax=Holophaga foetida TaxID=35839 RepID=UPI0002473353|nr:ABC transporter substrate-binding protein [Holophaga foetida]
MNKASAITTALTALLTLNLACDKSSDKEIRVGFIQAQTGPYAPFGEGGLFGAEAAIEDINKQGGVMVGNTRMLLKLVAVDDESDPAKTASLAEKLISSEKVRFIVSGDEPPVMHGGVSQVTDQHKVPYITSVGIYEPWVTQRLESPTKWQFTWATGSFAVSTPAERGDFRAVPGYTVMDTFAKMLEICGTQTNRKLGLLASDDPDGKESYSSMGAALQNLGYTVVGFDRQLGLLPMGTSDFSPVIQAWKEAGVEILMGNCPGPFFAKAWQQAQAQGLKPKMATISRAALFHSDIAALGGELPLGLGTEVWWDPSLKNAPGINGTTPQSLAERWSKAKSKPVSPSIGTGYASVQVLADAIQRAGSLEPEKVNAALGKTDLPTIRHRVKFDEDHFSRGPIAFGQWMKTDKPQKWELKVVFSNHEFWPANGSPVFPLK